MDNGNTLYANIKLEKKTEKNSVNGCSSLLELIYGSLFDSNNSINAILGFYAQIHEL